jgi:hypothetical protein
MVLTRANRRQIGERPRARPLPRRGIRPNYNPHDRCKRHRLPDRKRFTVPVRTYSRRLPN